MIEKEIFEQIFRDKKYIRIRLSGQSSQERLYDGEIENVLANTIIMKNAKKIKKPRVYILKSEIIAIEEYDPIENKDEYNND